jgi:uncharacterized protein (DUF1501 family)
MMTSTSERRPGAVVARGSNARYAFNPDGPAGDILVVVFLRGAADALNMVVPHGDADYYTLRPTLGIARPDDTRTAVADRALDLDGFFGLHPSLSPLRQAWDDRRLAIVHATGAPDDSRSHFLSMELMERGASDASGPASGWLARYLAGSRPEPASPMRAVAWGDRPPRSLLGSVPVTTLRSIADAHLGSEQAPLEAFQAALASLYQPIDSLGEAGQEALRLIGSLDRLGDTGHTTPQVYPETDFGRALEQTVRLIHAEVGLEVAALDLGGWDTHFAQGGSRGLMASLMAELAAGLAAFYDDLGTAIAGVTLITMSEFGRRAYENGSLGTDHGHGSCMFLLGGGILGGKVHGRWPGLHADKLFGPGDLAVTTDYRDVLAELCLPASGVQDQDGLFPGYRARRVGLRG